MMGGYGGGMGWSWLFWGLLIAGIVMLVVLAVRVIGGGIHRGGADGRPPAGSTRPTAAERILDERYARGELSTEEYQERLRELKDRTQWNP